MREDPARLTYPVVKIDYTQWGAYLDRQAPVQRRKGLFGWVVEMNIVCWDRDPGMVGGEKDVEEGI